MCIIVKTTNRDLKFKVFICHVYGPGKFLALGFIVDLLNGNAPFLTPKKKEHCIGIH